MKNILSNKYALNFQHKMWDSVLNNECTKEVIVQDYLTGHLRLNYFETCGDDFSSNQIEEIISILIESLKTISIVKIIDLLKHCNSLREITASNVPQFSNFATAAICVPETLVKASVPISYRDLGYSLFSESKSEIAADKYGENHGKLAVLLDLAAIKQNNGHKVFCTSLISKRFCQMAHDDRMKLLTRLCYNIPIIQYSVTEQNPQKAADECMQRVLAYSTYTRRKSNVLEVLAFALEN